MPYDEKSFLLGLAAGRMVWKAQKRQDGKAFPNKDKGRAPTPPSAPNP